MARFRATIRGQRGEASRLGSAKSGLAAYVNGWNKGVYVYASVDKNGNDTFRVYETQGSNGIVHEKLIAEITDWKNVRVTFRQFVDGEIIAIFPDMKEPNGMLLSYMHNGQHSPCDPELIGIMEKPVDHSALLAELKTIYETVKVI